MKIDNVVLESDRLRLRQFTIHDAGFIVALLNTPGWLKNIGDRNIKTEEQAKEYLLNGPIKSYQENGFGLSLVELSTDGTPIGMCGLLKRDYLDNHDIGFAFLPDYTGKGYAFEIVTATMKYAKDKLKIPVIMAIVLPTNKPSIKLLEKAGLKFLRTTTSPTTAEALMLFSN